MSQDQLVVCMLEAALSPDAVGAPDVTRLEDGVCSIRLSFHMRRQQGAMILEPPGGGAAPAVRVDRALVRAIVLAKVWAAELEIGEVESITALARRERLCSHYSARLLPLAYLAPDIVEQIVGGRQPRAATLAALTARALPLDWADQRDLLQRL